MSRPSLRHFGTWALPQAGSDLLLVRRDVQGLKTVLSGQSLQPAHRV